MKTRLPLLVTLVLIAAMLGVSLWAWTAIPADALLPIHWGIDGKPNGFAGKTFGLFFAPGLAALIGVVFAVIPLIEPRRANLLSSSKFYRASWIGVIALMAAVHGATVAAALRYPIDVGAVVLAAASLLFIVIGNYLGKTRSNFFAGVRTPWTLSSEYSWERTHRLAGRLFMITGAATIAALIALTPELATFILLGLSGATVAAALVMSYVYWARDPDRQAGDPAPR